MRKYIRNIILILTGVVVIILIGAAVYFLQASNISAVVGLPMLSIGAVVLLMIIRSALSGFAEILSPINTLAGIRQARLVDTVSPATERLDRDYGATDPIAFKGFAALTLSVYGVMTSRCCTGITWMKALARNEGSD
ncbi:hypothetical protein ACVIRO_007629 [Rhizobium ruizarguesonis]